TPRGDHDPRSRRDLPGRRFRGPGEGSRLCGPVRAVDGPSGEPAMKTKFRRRLALLGFLVWDVVIAALAFVLAGAFLEFGPPPWPLSSLRTPEPLVFVAVCLLVWHITLIRLKLYDSRRLGAGVGELRDLIV